MTIKAQKNKATATFINLRNNVNLSPILSEKFVFQREKIAFLRELIRNITRSNRDITQNTRDMKGKYSRY